MAPGSTPPWPGIEHHHRQLAGTALGAAGAPSTARAADRQRRQRRRLRRAAIGVLPGRRPRRLALDPVGRPPCRRPVDICGLSLVRRQQDGADDSERARHVHRQAAPPFGDGVISWPRARPLQRAPRIAGRASRPRPDRSPDVGRGFDCGHARRMPPTDRNPAPPGSGARSRRSAGRRLAADRRAWPGRGGRRTPSRQEQHGCHAANRTGILRTQDDRPRPTALFVAGPAHVLGRDYPIVDRRDRHYSPTRDDRGLARNVARSKG